MPSIFCITSATSVPVGAHCVKMDEDIRKLYATELYPTPHSFIAIYCLRRCDVGNRAIGGLSARGVAKCSDFGPIEGKIAVIWYIIRKP